MSSSGLSVQDVRFYMEERLSRSLARQACVRGRKGSSFRHAKRARNKVSLKHKYANVQCVTDLD